MKVLCADHIDVSVPAESAFSFIADISRWPVWMSSVVCAEHPQSLPLALREEVLLCLQAGKKRRQETFEVTRFVANAFLSLEGAYSAARRIDFRFEQRGPSTRIAYAIGYPVFGLAAAWIDGALRRRRVRSELRESLQRLKGLLEERGESEALGEYLFDDGTHARSAGAQSAAQIQEPAGAM